MPIVLITGGAGFIGSYLCELFLKNNYRVICMDNLITGNLENIRGIQENKKFRFIRHDVSNYIDLDEHIDYILHFASPASPIDYLNYPIQTLKVGSLGTHNALGLAKAHKAKFLLASTSEIYGDPQIHPQPETYWGNVNCVGPRGVYDEAKRFAEAITMAYHRVHKIDTKIVRIFNTYGPRMRRNDGRAVPAFITQAINGTDITVFGDGRQTRSFCYVTDLITGIYKLMLSDVNHPVNIGNPNEFTILELAKLIIELTKTKSKIINKPLPEDDPKVRQPDITKAKGILNWQPRIELEEGLRKTIEWFKNNW
ncbi:MAG: UDP-glucuronic acid decarboxylase family protein [Candidatus Omnitrophota bacterium]